MILYWKKISYDIYWQIRRRAYEREKIFILAVPTIIIIVIAIVGISLIFYSRNLKKMSKEDVKLLAQKVVKIENISCEVITTTDKEASIQSVEDYKLKNGVMISKVDDFVIYDNKETQTLMQIDDEEKLVYTYGKYNSEIDNFKTMLLTAESLLMNDKNEYIFKDFVTMNGIKCINFELKNNDTIFEIWMDKNWNDCENGYTLWYRRFTNEYICSI